ncbi:uncharacterized protein J4E84_002831 [Alternaria hordeiaustralica]|uniref:uncharacterized protein n=1 Tax=Alternaria hordeiaustralica TaxID=1187925 RepID=UPI0020C361F8|nr:uncharacterized protein J4E84_002831 [Alternaria hordeiaustralica]KAI4694249.1 hypothetical protein J4E84_002831 [Alternaria hordeiaustralica]
MRYSIVFDLLLVGAAVALPGAGRKRDYSEGHIGRRQDGPVAPDTASDCSYYDTARTGFSTCAAFQSDWGLTFDQFFDYNPSVKADCSGINIGQAYCVEVNFGLPRPTSAKSSATSAPSTTSRISTTATATVTSAPKPAPTQPGLIASCTSFYFAVANDNCNKIVASYGTFSYDDFVAWNPAVGASCDGLWKDTYYCVGIPGTPSTRPSTSTVPATTTQRPTTSAGPAKPSPTQDGLISSCTSFYFAVRGDNCDKIVKQYGTFTLGEFVAWNPAVNTDCSGIWADTYYCVGIPGTPTTRPVTTTTPPSTTTMPTTTKPTTTGNGISTPLPTQSGMVTNCNKFHWIARGVTCNQVISYQKISLADFVKWNPTVDSDCSGMQSDVNVCVSVVGSPTTTPPTTTTSAGNGVQTPRPTQPGMVTNCKKFHFAAKGVTCSQIISYQKISLANFVKWNPGVGDDCRNMWADTHFCVGV